MYYKSSQLERWGSNLNAKIAPYIPFVCMGTFLIAVQLIALTLVNPLSAHNIRAFDDPHAILNPIWYFYLILMFTLVALLVIKLDLKWVLYTFILMSVASTLFIVFFGISAISSSASVIGPLIGAGVLTLLVYKFPEWYVIDVTGILIGAGVAAIFGISLAIVPTMILLIALMIYDAIAVYKTKHMLTLAEGVIDLKIPVLFIVPKRWSYSFLKPKDKHDAYYMGLGDAVMPSILTVSAMTFIDAPSFGFINIPALGAIAGSLIGFAILMSLVAKGKPQAGLPFLNTGAILGFMIGYLCF